MKWKSLLAVLLAAMLLLSGCRLQKIESSSESSSSSQSQTSAPEGSGSSSESSEAPDPTEEPSEAYNAEWLAEREKRLSTWSTFDDLSYERPDIDLLVSEINALTERAADETDPDAFFQAYAQLDADYAHYADMGALVSLYYDLDVTNEENSAEVEWLGEQQSNLTPLIGKMYDAMFSNETLSAWCQEHWKEASIEYAKSTYSLFPDNISELNTQLNSLLLEYDQLKNSFTVPVGGEDWTLADFYSYDGSGSVTADEFYSGYNAYQEAFSDAAGAYYLEMRDLRVEMAARAGYSSYADYMYTCYGCDYNSQDAASFCQAVKDNIAPLFADMYWDLETDSSYRLYSHSYNLEDTLAAMQSVFSTVDDRLSDSLELMLSRQMYDAEPAPNKQSGSYTTFCSEDGSPFLFTSFTGSYQNVSDVLHEFGHFNSYARIPECKLEEVDSIDLAEIDSQSLVLLMIPRYGDFFSPALADSAGSEALLDAMYALLTGCMEDEFQRYVYENPQLTLDELTAYYGTLAEDYCFDTTYGYTPYSWCMVDHTFSSPMYYISYALSMAPALELWADSLDDWEGTVQRYLDFIDQRGHGYTFRAALDTFGFTDPFSESDALMRDIAANLEDYGYNTILG